MPHLSFPVAGPAYRLHRTALIALTAILAAATDSPAQTAQDFHTANGATVRMPAPAGLSCAELDAKLAEIDRTGFRGNGPVPLDSQDQPLYHYERKVAHALYTRCGGEMSDADTADIMRRGFVKR